MDKPNNELVTVIEQAGLDEPKAATLYAGFNGIYQQASVLVADAKNIAVTEESDVEGMTRAREVRLALKRLRVEAEELRKTSKEGIVREGKAIDGVANILKAMIVPAEEWLEQQEKFAEIARAKREQEVYDERVRELSPFVGLSVAHYNLREMTEDEYATVLSDAKANHQRWLDEEAALEKERIEREKEEERKRALLAEENKRLKAEAEEREKKIAAERALATKQAEKERLERDRKQKELEAKATAEREAREKVEREMREREEAEAKAREEAQAQALAAEMAPDKVKLAELAEAIRSFPMPTMKTKKTQAVILKIESVLLDASQEIKRMIATL